MKIFKTIGRAFHALWNGWGTNEGRSETELQSNTPTFTGGECLTPVREPDTTFDDFCNFAVTQPIYIFDRDDESMVRFKVGQAESFEKRLKPIQRRRPSNSFGAFRNKHADRREAAYQDELEFIDTEREAAYRIWHEAMGNTYPTTIIAILFQGKTDVLFVFESIQAQIDFSQAFNGVSIKRFGWWRPQASYRKELWMSMPYPDFVTLLRYPSL